MDAINTTFIKTLDKAGSINLLLALSRELKIVIIDNPYTDHIEILVRLMVKSNVSEEKFDANI